MKKVVLMISLVGLVTSCTTDDLDVVESNDWFSRLHPQIFSGF